VNAMAIMPDTSGRGSAHCRSVYKAAPDTGDSNFQHSAGYRQTLVNAPANGTRPGTVADAVKDATTVPQELIVLTAFEQVQAEGDVLGDRVVSDYGTNTIARPAEGSAGRVTVTRLIFRVYAPTAGARESDGPNGSAGSSESNILTGLKQPIAIPTSATGADAATQSTNPAMGKPASPATANPVGQAARADVNSQDANSLASRPNAVALGNGWFVIQL
jgi:hypothetical protein